MTPRKTANKTNTLQTRSNISFHFISRMGLLDLEKHFAFYGAYHSNHVNVLIHTVFVWPILFTGQIILYFAPPLISVGFLPSVLVLNSGFFATLFYALFYIALDHKAGSLAAFLTFFCWVASSFVANSLGFSLAWKVLLNNTNTNSTLHLSYFVWLFSNDDSVMLLCTNLLLCLGNDVSEFNVVLSGWSTYLWTFAKN